MFYQFPVGWVVFLDHFSTTPNGNDEESILCNDLLGQDGQVGIYGSRLVAYLLPGFRDSMNRPLRSAGRLFEKLLCKVIFCRSLQRKDPASFEEATGAFF